MSLFPFHRWGHWDSKWLQMVPQRSNKGGHGPKARTHHWLLPGTFYNTAHCWRTCDYALKSLSQHPDLWLQRNLNTRHSVWHHSMLLTSHRSPLATSLTSVKGTVGSRQSIPKAWTVRNWLHLAVSCSQQSRPPTAGAASWNTRPLLLTLQMAGFGRPMLSPLIRQSTQIAFPLKVLSYQNMKDRTFKWNLKTTAREGADLYNAHQQNVCSKEHFNQLSQVMLTG